MGELSERDVEDVLGGVQPPGREDLAPVVELTTWLHASREIEPAPAMRDDLFRQIEDGFGAYQRSSRRSPAHMRRRAGMRLSVRRTLAGSRRPIASVAAAVVLLVGVILAVRAGGPAREPSAYVSPSARGLPAPGPAEPSSSTTAASTTTSPPDTAAEPEAAGTTVPAQEPSVTRDAAAKASPPADATSPDRRPGDDAGTAPPTNEEQRREAEAGDPARSEQEEQHSATDRLPPPPTADAADETAAWDLSLSGWNFDLSEGLWATELWAALHEAEGTGDAVYRGDDGPADDVRSHDRGGGRATKRHRNLDDERTRRADDREQEGGRPRY
jgi:hypothetical protein